MLRQPFGKKVEAASSTLRADAVAPGGPPRDEGSKPQATDNFVVGRMFEQPHRSPVTIKAAEAQLAAQYRLELLGADVVVPNVREARILG